MEIVFENVQDKMGWINWVVTLIAAFAGSWVAFLFNKRTNSKEQERTEKSSLFQVKYIIEHIKAENQQIIEFLRGYTANGKEVPTNVKAYYRFSDMTFINIENILFLSNGSNIEKTALGNILLVNSERKNILSLLEERNKLYFLYEERFDAAEQERTRVDGFSSTARENTDSSAAIRLVGRAIYDRLKTLTDQLSETSNNLRLACTKAEESIESAYFNKFNGSMLSFP